MQYKTIVDFLDKPEAQIGDMVTITGGAFQGQSGRVVAFDGIWRTVKVLTVSVV